MTYIGKFQPEWREDIEKRLAAGESQRSIARSYGVCYQSVQYWREKWDLPKLKPAQQYGADHPNWKGGTSFDRYGYKLVYTPGRKAHPYSYEHVLVAEQKIGRRMRKGEHVHHINGNKTDNHPDNLLVMTDTDHRKLHRQLERLAMDMVRTGEVVFDGVEYRRR